MMWANARFVVPPTPNARNTPIPSIEFKATLVVDFGEVSPEGARKQMNPPSVLSMKPSVSIQGVPLLLMEWETPRNHSSMTASGELNFEYGCTAYLDRTTLHAIEKNRSGDVNVSFHVELMFLQEGSRVVQGSAGTNLKLSQLEWGNILTKLGWKSLWIVEMDRPQIEGWSVVEDHLHKAEERLVARDADGVMKNCRFAWEAADPLLEGKWAELARVMDSGSKGESGEPPKSERIQNIRKWVLKFNHSGLHADYATTMDDAVVTYRLTVSLLAYLSRKAATGTPQGG